MKSKFISLMGIGSILAAELIVNKKTCVCNDEFAQIILSYANRRLMISGGGLLQPQNGSAKTMNSKTPIRILHVDDDISVLEISKQILEDMNDNFEVDFASCVDDGFKKLETGNYDVVVSDYEMPRKNGLDFLKHLKEQNNQIPFILFTGKGRERIAIEALNLGADGYFDKQGSPETVYGELSHGILHAVTRGQAEKKLQAMYRYIPVPTYTWQAVNDDFLLVDYNDAALKITQGHIADFIGTKLSKMYADNPQILNDTTQCFKNRTTTEREMLYTFHNPTHKQRFLNVKYAYVPPDLVLVHTEDITERKKAERELKIFSLAIQKSNDGVVIGELNGNITYVNDAILEMCGNASKNDIIGKHVLEFIAERDRPRVTQNSLESLRTGQSYLGQYTGLRNDGSEFQIEVATAIIKDEKGHGIGFVDIIRNISERKIAESKLKESEDRYSKLSSAAFEGIAITREGKILDVNSQFAKMFGYESSELVGMSVSGLVAPESRELVKANMQKGYEGPYEHLALKKDGSVFPVEVRAKSILYKKQLARVTAIQDITERKKAEEARLLSETRFRLLYENSLEGILLARADGKILSANIAACKMFGMSEEEIKRATRKELVVDAERLKPAIDERERTGKATVELTFRRKDGSIFEGEVTSTAFKDIDGSTKTNMIIRDITGRKEKEKEDRAKADEIREVIDCIGDLLFVIDKNHVIIKVNKTTCDMFKKSAEELIGRHCYEIVHGTDKPYPLCPALKTLQTKQVVTEEINDPNVGIPLLVTTAPILDEQGEVVQVIHVAKDISKIKIAEMEMQVAANLFDAASDSILVHDLEGRIVYFNEACYKTRGYSRDEFQTLKISDLEAPGDTLVAESRIKLVIEKGEAIFEAANLRKDKSVVLLEVHSRVIESDGRKMILSVARDISERKKAEEMLKENSARIEVMNEKLRVVGGLTRHDVRNKLAAVNGHAYLLKKKHGDQPDIVEELSKIELAVKDSVKIFEFAKMYEQLGAEELTYVDVGTAADEAVALFSGLTLKVVNDCHGRSVLADSFLRQMFYNFIDNTRKYGKKATTAKMYFGQEDSGCLRLIYEDDGVGISAENKPQLFKEGFSTGGSTGFGLFFIKKMMDVYGWTITEEGEPGKGAKFIITIPM